MDSSLLDISTSNPTWNPPSSEIQRLFHFDDSVTKQNNDTIHRESSAFTDEEFAKMPSTLMKAIRRTDLLLEQTEQARKSAIDANNELKCIHALMIRYAKRTLKDANKPETKSASDKGFRRPCRISSEMCAFMGISEGTQSSRVEVNQFIHDYVKNHGLVDDENGQNIVPDEKLWAILSENARGNKITYFSIQKYIKHHFTPMKIYTL